MIAAGDPIGAAARLDGSRGDVVQEALTAVRRHLGMEIAYFSEFVDGQSVFRRVDAPGLEHLIKVGDSRPLEDVYCTHIVEGRLPELIPDTALEPLARAMPITSAVPIGSHVSIPIRLPDGRPFGMFCCLSPRPNRTLNPRDLETMRVFAELATKQVHTELQQNRAEHAKRSAVEGALSQRAFEIAYQPIVELSSMRIVSVEALCRFRSEPYRSPDRWFQDAADVGLGIDLELGAVAAALAGFDELPAGVTMSVNASPDTIASGRLWGALDRANLHRTIVEVTEHAHVADYTELNRRLTELRRLGVGIAIDDAGAGYAGLQQIVQLAPDLIKMDMSLTRGIDVDGARRALASAMIYYARETGATIVAEGIETREELLTLKTLGAARGQGYHLGRPGRLEAIDFGPREERRGAA